MIPKEPAGLLSFINMKLRDMYPDLDALCDDLDADKEEIVNILEAAGYRYDTENNQFR